jgi:hypothetical protein
MAACAKFRSTVLGLSGLVPAAELHWGNEVFQTLFVVAHDAGIAVAELAPHIGVKRHLLRREYKALAKHCREVIPRVLSAEEVLYGVGPVKSRAAKLEFHEHIERLLSYASET